LLVRKIVLPVITKSHLARDLNTIGVLSSQTIMLHISVRAVGRVVVDPISSFSRAC